MHLHSFRVRNYRRLRDTHVELARDISIFVGANNSGKTSATQAIQFFVGASKERCSLYDFNTATWAEFDALGEGSEVPDDLSGMPSLSLDLWFEVGAADLYLVIPLLPSTQWQGTHVGVRIEFAAENPQTLIAKFREARDKAKQKAEGLAGGAGTYTPWPKTLSDYLQRELKREFEFRYYVLDRAEFNEQFEERGNCSPRPMTKGEGGGAAVLGSLIKVDCLSAQRHLADPAGGSGGGGRAEDLSKRLSKFYQRNLDQRAEDHSALKALFDSESELNKHLAAVFKPTLERLKHLGYRGLGSPQLEIRSALNPATVLNQDARVHYVLGDGAGSVALPDTYNGLGFKNLIYMVVEILDVQERWGAEDEKRAPLHLIFIEEPEAHLHAQLQQVFIRNILTLLKIDGEEGGVFSSQVAVTTHSPHILYERGFQPIRYFRRASEENGQTSDVLNLSTFYEKTAKTDRDFLRRYLKLTHCDLFFADAAILVEGNVERLLLPAMIDKSADTLRSVCLSVLEVGGAFAHKFKELIEFLGLTALVITDIDSVAPVADKDATGEDDEVEFEVPGADENAEPIKKKGKTCSVDTAGAVTSNQTLATWLPKLKTIEELRVAPASARTQRPTDQSPSTVRVAYQVPRDVTWNGTTEVRFGRTLEEDFGLENAEWCQSADRKHLGLKLKDTPASFTELAEGLHKRVVGSAFDKTRFALGVLTETRFALSDPTEEPDPEKEPDDWSVPFYIREGLVWLAGAVALETEAQGIDFPAAPEGGE